MKLHRHLTRDVPLHPRGRREWARAAGLCVIFVALTGAYAERQPVIVMRVETVEIPVPVTVHRTRHLARGWEVILEPGRPGAYAALVRETRVLGRLTRREELETRLLRAPVGSLRLAGTNPEDNAIHAPQTTRAVTTHRMLATGYDPGPDDNGWAHAGTTKLGWRTRRGIVAVDPSIIPLRSLLYVEGYGLAWAGDVGGAIKGKRLDLCFNCTEDAQAWGRRRTRAYVLEGVRHPD